MFEQTLALSAGRTNKPWTVVVSFAGQLVVVGLAVLAPLIATDTLKPAHLRVTVFGPPLPPPPPPPPSEPRAEMTRRIPAQITRAGLVMAPRAIPHSVAMIIEDEPPVAAGGGVGVEGGVPGGIPSGVLHGVLSAAAQVPPPPPPPPVAIPQEPKPQTMRIRQGGDVQEGKLTHRPTPVYPQLARQARISGMVRLEGVISKEGKIIELRVVSGHPLLTPAAVAAVKQWIYRPTLLNREPVEVIALIDVHFTLN